MSTSFNEFSNVVEIGIFLQPQRILSAAELFAVRTMLLGILLVSPELIILGDDGLYRRYRALTNAPPYPPFRCIVL